MKQFLFPKCLIIALLFLAPFFLHAQITKASGGDYITLMGVPENQIATQVNIYKDQGYMPVFVDACFFEGKPLQGTSRPANLGVFATLIFKKNPGRINVQLAKYNSSNVFLAQYAALKAQGWYISNLDAYLNNNQEAYLAIWVKGNSAPWGIVVDSPLNQHQNAFNQLSSEGYRMVNRVYHNQPAPGDEVVDVQHITSLFTKQSNPIFAKSQLTYPEYAKLCVDMKQQDFVLTFLDIHRGYFSPIFTKKPNFTPLSTFPAHGQSSVLTKQAIEQWSQQGYYPLFVICDSAAQEDYYPQYAVWLVKAN